METISEKTFDTWKKSAEALEKKYTTWKDKLHKEMHGEKLMFDVPGHYKWLNEDELFIYYMDIGTYSLYL